MLFKIRPGDCARNYGGFRRRIGDTEDDHIDLRQRPEQSCQGRFRIDERLFNEPGLLDAAGQMPVPGMGIPRAPQDFQTMLQVAQLKTVVPGSAARAHVERLLNAAPVVIVAA